LKAWKVLVLCTIIVVAALSILVALASALTTVYHYYSWSFDGSYLPGSDCGYSSYYTNVVSIQAGYISSSHPGARVYNGYWSTKVPGTGWGNIVIRTTPGYGPASPPGWWYGIWGNKETYPLSVSAICAITSDGHSHPMPR